MRLVVASRGSKLALRQADIFSTLLREVHPGVDVEVRVVKTTGDRDERPFAEIGGKGLFTSEVEREVAEGGADVAVHSAKDLTAELADGCHIVCVPQRAGSGDVVIGGRGSDGMERIASLPRGATVGTSSMRRKALLMEARPDLEVVEFRGNLDTRLRKVGSDVDAAILAEAGIRRLGLWDESDPGLLDVSWWVPPPGQGALAIEARADRADLTELLSPLNDAAAGEALAAERAFSARLEGGCSVPLGCHGVARDGRIVLTGFLGHPSGTHGIRDRISGPASSAQSMGTELAEAILAGGGDDILDEIRADDVPPPPAP